VKIKLGVSILAVCLLLSISGCGFFKSGPSQIVEEFYNAVEAGEIEKALTLVSSRAVGVIGEDKLKAGFAQQTRQIEAEGGVTLFEITEEKVKGESAEVTIRMVLGDGEAQTETIPLIQEDGDWKIDLQLRK